MKGCIDALIVKILIIKRDQNLMSKSRFEFTQLRPIHISDIDCWLHISKKSTPIWKTSYLSSIVYFVYYHHHSMISSFDKRPQILELCQFGILTWVPNKINIDKGCSCLYWFIILIFALFPIFLSRIELIFRLFYMKYLWPTLFNWLRTCIIYCTLNWFS